MFKIDSWSDFTVFKTLYFKISIPKISAISIFNYIRERRLLDCGQASSIYDFTCRIFAYSFIRKEMYRIYVYLVAFLNNDTEYCIDLAKLPRYEFQNTLLVVTVLMYFH